MNFFGVEISDAQFDAAMNVARSGDPDGSTDDAIRLGMAIRKALGFETGDVAAPPATNPHPYWAWLPPWF